METITKENLCIIIITYNPTDNNYVNLSKWALDNCDNVIVVDNGSQGQTKIAQNLPDGVNIIKLQKNHGISGAVNMALSKIREGSYRYILTFDQDSFPPKDLLNAYNYVLRREINVGLLGVNFYPPKINSSSMELVYRHSLDQITSGLLHNVEIFKSVGLYNEKLFIDCVDFEYTLRVKSAGYDTFMIDNISLTHTIGNPKIVKLGFLTIQSIPTPPAHKRKTSRHWLSRKDDRHLCQ